MDIRAISLKVWMWLHFYLYHQVACWTTKSGISFFRNSQIDSVINSFWYVYGFFYRFVSYSFASARCAWVPDNGSCTVTVATHLLDHERSLSYSLKASTCTSSTFAFACSWFCSCSLACSADISPSELNSLLSSVDSLHEINFNHNYDVFAFHSKFDRNHSFPKGLLNVIYGIEHRFGGMIRYIYSIFSLLRLLVSLIECSHEYWFVLLHRNTEEVLPRHLVKSLVLQWLIDHLFDSYCVAISLHIFICVACQCYNVSQSVTFLDIVMAVR